MKDVAGNAIVPGGDDDRRFNWDHLFRAIEADWHLQGLCAQTDPEAFFQEKGGSSREARRICKGCPVRDECLEFALKNDERFGVWGGMSAQDRKRLKERRIQGM